MNETLKFIVPPGIGDISWLYSKLSNLNTDLEFKVPWLGGRRPRAVPYLRVLPKVVRSSYDNVRNPATSNSIKPNESKAALIKAARRHFVPIEVNNWLNEGNRLEGFLPWLDTDFHYELSLESEEPSFDLVPERNFICFFLGSETGNKAWKGWYREWIKFIELTWDHFRPDVIITIGSSWDASYTNKVIHEIPSHINIRSVTGHTSISTCLHLIRRSRFLVGFASGLSVMATVMKTKTLMLYPAHHEKLMRSWPPKESIEDKSYIGLLFSDGPKRAFKEIQQWV